MSNRIGKPYRGQGNNTYLRWDGTGIVHVRNLTDTTPVQVGGYNSHCGWCYLGYPHSEAEHQAQLEKDL